MITMLTGHCFLVIWMLTGCFTKEIKNNWDEAYSSGWHDGCRAAVTYYERKKED